MAVLHRADDRAGTRLRRAVLTCQVKTLIRCVKTRNPAVRKDRQTIRKIDGNRHGRIRSEAASAALRAGMPVIGAGSS
ncbi:hypothetical protein GV68_03440 [Pseudorhizobium pelagicum]|uniref:Uncharacterized protein n=1 Tax=Pseudorhizobium pelagicum TaxID=1509405 RepID=A0A922TB10_9HYPH|nr:hypothetical protein GV68_03440 [Pseudorhizobium pelagicum]